MLLHVDDILFAMGKQHEYMVKDLSRRFIVCVITYDTFKYLGMQVEVTRENGVVTHVSVSQEKYALSLQEGAYFKEKKVHESLNELEHTEYRRVCRELQWLAQITRVDMAFKTMYLSLSLHAPTIQDMKTANQSLRKVQKNSLVLNYLPLTKNLQLYLYCDASFAGLPCASSCGGAVLYLTSDGLGNQRVAVPILWRSWKLRRVARSTLAAETICACDALDRALPVKALAEFLFNCKIPLVLLSDCKSLVDCVLQTRKQSSITEKRLLVDIQILREALAGVELADIRWVDTKSQLADALTRAMSCNNLTASFRACSVTSCDF